MCHPTGALSLGADALQSVCSGHRDRTSARAWDMYRSGSSTDSVALEPLARRLAAASASSPVPVARSPSSVCANARRLCPLVLRRGLPPILAVPLSGVRARRLALAPPRKQPLCGLASLAHAPQSACDQVCIGRTSRVSPRLRVAVLGKYLRCYSVSGISGTIPLCPCIYCMK